MENPPDPAGLGRAGVIDLVAHDPARDEAVLVMFETRPWDGSEARLIELQEKANAYVAFALDGEMAEALPALRGKRARVELRSVHMPDPATGRFLELLRASMPEGVRFELLVARTAGGQGGGA